MKSIARLIDPISPNDALIAQSHGLSPNGGRLPFLGMIIIAFYGRSRRQVRRDVRQDFSDMRKTTEIIRCYSRKRSSLHRRN